MTYRVTSEKRLPSCKLDKEDIVGLVQIAKNNMARVAEVELAIEFNGQKITDNKTESLLKNPGLPNKIYSLSIEVRDENSWVDISFSRHDCTSESVVRGQNEELVNGKQMQILDFIKKRKTKNFIFHKPLLFIVAMIPLWISILFYDKSSLGQVTLGLSFVFYLSVTALVLSSHRLFPYSVVEIKKKNSNSLTWAFIVGLLTSLIAGIIISLLFKA